MNPLATVSVAWTLHRIRSPHGLVPDGEWGAGLMTGSFNVDRRRLLDAGEDRRTFGPGAAAMTFVVKVTHPWHTCTLSPEYAPREHEADSSEEAIQIFQIEAGPMRFDLCAANTRLFDGGRLEWKDRYTGKTVVAFKVTHVITVTHLFSGDRDDYELKVGAIEEAAETFESEVSRDLVTYDVVLEALQEEGTFQYEDDETGRIFEVRELVGAVA